MDMETIKFFLWIIFGSILFLGSFFLGLQAYDLNIANSFEVKCWVDEKLVYEGKAACIGTHSEGASTSVQINGGFMCFIPQEHYVSKNVRLEGKR